MLLFLTLFLAIESSLASDGFLWRIESEPHPAYLFGTIHVPYDLVWPSVPKKVKTVLGAADHVFLELDEFDPDLELDFRTCEQLPNGQRVSDVLPPELYAKVKSRFKQLRRELPIWLTELIDTQNYYIDTNVIDEEIIGDWQRKRPIWLALALDELTKENVQYEFEAEPILDSHIANFAQKHHKSIDGIETVFDGCEAFNNMPQDMVNYWLEDTLKSVEQNDNSDREKLNDLIDSYNKAEFNSTDFLLYAMDVDVQFDDDTLKMINDTIDYFTENLHKKRNRKWVPKIVDLLKNEPDKRYFFAFGVAHFFGEDSVVDLLRQEGFNVTRVKSSASMTSPNSAFSVIIVLHIILRHFV